MEREQTFDAETLDDWDSDSKESDPAVLAAQYMVERAVATRPDIEASMALQGCIVVVQTPAAVWSELICFAWLRQFFGGCPMPSSRGRWRREDDCFAILRNGRNLQPVDPSELLSLAEKTWRGHQLIVFSSAPREIINRSFVDFADYEFEVPSLASTDIQKLISEATGEEAEVFLSPEDTAGISPALLRLARRPFQTAAEYASKILRVTSNALPTHRPSASPRAAPTLTRLHGMNEAVAWGMKLANDIADFKAGKLKWCDVDQGCLLSGPPGVGKTLFARALSETCAVPLVLGSYSIWHSSGGGHQGAFLKAMRRAFSDAKKQAPVILFIDEIDSFPNRATLRHDWADYEIQIVNALLAELDGTEAREGVVVIGACNLPEKLDPALIRSGRLDKHIRIELPNPAALGKILREHLGPDLLDADLATVALAAAGSSGADCERYVRGARRTARVAGRPMHLDDLAEEIGGHDHRSEAELLRAAIHEAGHAYAFATLLPGRLEAVSIRGVGSLGGTTASKNPNSPLTAADARVHMVTLLCGRAAEQVFYGDPSSGAGGTVHSDLGIATRWATAAAASLGFSKELGLAWRGDPDQANLSDMMASNPGLASVVQAELGAAYQEALLLIEGGRESVSGLATALVRRRALSAEQVAAILASTACR